jgi:isopenicillin-N epimerase
MPGHGAPWVGYFDPLQADLYETARIEVPIFPFPRPPHRLLRVSTPAYVTDDDIARLVGALRQRSRTASGEGATRG